MFMAAPADKVIVSCAVTGCVHTPTRSAYLSITPDQIAEQAIEAAEAGATILHLHARDPLDGRPTADPTVFDQFVPRIAAATDAVLNITIGGSMRMTLDERLAYPLQAKPEMCSLSMGLMNSAVDPAARKYSDWRRSLNKLHAHGAEDLIFRDIKNLLKVLGDDCGTRFEFECHDVGHLYSVAHLVDEGLVKGPLFIQSIYGTLGGLGPDPENLVTIRTIADRLFGRRNYHLSVLGADSHPMPLLTMAAVMGGNVRVGLEDSLYLGRGQFAQSCAEQVRKIRRILEELSLEIATPEETRAMLGLKGNDAVAFSGREAQK
jgi:uncharacterized protein (DUF849 family)